MWSYDDDDIISLYDKQINDVTNNMTNELKKEIKEEKNRCLERFTQTYKSTGKIPDITQCIYERRSALIHFPEQIHILEKLTASGYLNKYDAIKDGRYVKYELHVNVRHKT